MKRSKHTHQYYGGRIKNLVEIVASTVAKNPGLANDLPLLHATLTASVEGYGKRESCFNCRRSMKITLYEADLHDALLIKAMSEVVKHNLNKGMTLTEANKIHLPTLNATNATIKRSTKCDYLCFIKQRKNWRGTGYWALTGWAFAALRGEPVHAAAKYWEGKLIERSTEKTTLDTFFKKHRELVERSIAKRKAVKADYRAQFADYNPADWSVTSGYIDDPEIDLSQGAENI
jgi:phage tail protein X